MSRLTAFSGCIIIIVIVAAFVWDYSHTRNQLTQARADLATAQYNFDQCQTARQSAEQYATALRNQASASQQNCATTLLRTQELFELALPMTFNPPVGETTGEGAGEVHPRYSPAPVKNPQPSSGASDAAFTDFLNTW